MLSFVFHKLKSRIYQDLFRKETSEDLVIKLLKLDLNQAENARIKELINYSQSVSYTDDEIESSIFLMVKKMKLDADSYLPSSNKLVKVEFYHGVDLRHHWKTLSIDTSKTAEELLDKLNESNSNPFVFLKFNGQNLEGDLKKYNLKDGDVIHYWVLSMNH